MTALLPRVNPTAPARHVGTGLLRPGPSFRPFAREELARGVSQRFEQQVRRFPDRLAIKSPANAITYAALNRLANRMARAILGRRGTGSEPVLLLFEKDAPLIAAMLAVLKAGKFYVPLSPSYPQARNALITRDSCAKLLLTDTPNLAAARQLAGDDQEVLNLDQMDRSVDANDLGVPIAPQNYAYIIYTSGSTGQPKGVVDTHQNLLQNIRRYTNSHYLSPDDRLICVSSCAFSNSLKDIYGALLNGGTLYLLDIERLGLAPLAGCLARERITVLNAVATVFRHFAAALTDGDVFPQLRVIRLGSEAVTRKDVELFKRHFGHGCVLVNGYGTTETGTARLNMIGKDTEVRGSALPIGYPVDGTEVLLLDEAGADVGYNRVGQIAIRSAFLSPGYWQKPELTAAAFLPDPDGGNRRIYLTGDLALKRQDNCLIYAGRKDHQVKIRGNRIELTEIEQALMDLPRIKEAVVVSRADLPEERSLVAYLVPWEDRGGVPSTSELRAFLKQRLPDYAIPSSFVSMATLPVTPTGKLDRKALAAPPPERPNIATAFVAPRNALETRLSEIWEGLLRVRPIGVKDNFFDLGGHSLLAAQLFLQIAKVFGRELPLATLLEEATVERLAHRLSQASALPAGSCLVPVQPRGSKPPFYCVHGIGGEVLSYERLARHLGTDQPFYGFQAQGLHQPKRHTHIEEMAAAYVAELLQFQPAGPYYLGGYSCGAIVAYEMAQQLCHRGSEVALLALIDQRRPNLNAGFAWSRQGMKNFLLNVPAWIWDDLLHSRPRELLGRFRLKARVVGKWLSVRMGLKPASQRGVGDWLDVSRIPDNYLALLETNFRAVRSYTPQPYAGRVTLFRARSQALFRWHEPLLGWRKLLRGPVEFKIIPGTHDRILTEPCVRILAKSLGASLERVRAK
jgi:amino acid adenylation domain-containing protein